MQRRRELLLALATSVAAVGLAAPAQADELDAPLRRVAKARATLKTLQASFHQKRVIGILAAAVESRGSLLMARPDRLRWQLAPPDAVTYWVGPGGFAMGTDAGVNKVGKAAAGRFAAVLEDLMTLLGGDLRKLRGRYELTVPQDSPRGLVLIAKPRPDKAPRVAKHVAKLTLEMGPELWTIRRVQIVERSGDRSDITFHDLKRNVPIDQALLAPPR